MLLTRIEQKRFHFIMQCNDLSELCWTQVSLFTFSRFAGDIQLIQ